MKKEFIATTTSALKKMIKKLNDNNIKPLLIQSPAFETYNKHLNNEKLDRIYKLANSFNAPFIDYLFDYRFNKEDYINNDHLNYEGAKKFSRIITKEGGLDECFKN